MYNDLTETLRQYGLTNGGSLGRHMGLMDEAADAIAALQIENAELLAALSRVEAERDAAVKRQKELDDALRDMVCQYCSHDGKLDHEFMSAGEHAFDVLDLDYGAPVDMLWRGAQGEG